MDERPQPQLVNPGYTARPEHATFWPLFGAGLASGVAGLATWAMIFGIAMVLLLSDQITRLDELRDGDLWEAARELLVALAIAGIGNVFVLAGLLKLCTRIFTQHAVRYGHALLIAMAALVAAAAGGLLDALLLGLSFGVFALACFAAAAGWLLQRFARPATA